MQKFLLFIFPLFFISLIAAASPYRVLNDTSQVILLNQKTALQLREGNAEQAKDYALEALALAGQLNYLPGKATAMMQLGRVYQQKGNFDEALNAYLQSSTLKQQLHDKAGIAAVYVLIGQLYREKENHEKALAYLKLALQLEQQLGRQEPQIQLEQSIGQVYYQLKRYPDALSYFRMAAEKQKQSPGSARTIETLTRLANLSILNNQYTEAVGYYEQVLPFYRKTKDTLTLAATLNNMGYIQRELNQPRKAFDYFSASLALYKALYAGTKGKEKKAVLNTNIAVIYTNLGYEENATQYFETALRLYEEEKRHDRIAEIYNYMATADLVAKRYEDAISDAMSSLEHSLPNNLKEQARDTYKILSDIYQSQNEYKKSQQYFKLYTDLKAEVEKINELKKRERLQNLVDLEKKESEAKLGLAEKQKQELMFRQLELESNKKEQELALQEKEMAILKKDADLQAAALINQQLEKIRVERELQLAREKIAADTRDRELTLLQKDKALKELELQKQKLLEQDQQKSIESLKAVGELQKQKLEEEAKLRLLGYGIMALFALIIVVVFIAYRRDHRKNALLRRQAEEISQKNDELLTREEELRQNMEELEATSERLVDVNAQLNQQQQELARKNHNITASINSAQRIQGAMLPTEQEIIKTLPEHFIMFKPRDIVSGDFYWFAEHDGKAIVAVVDCTGHGVPGAFMSMIGDSLLNQIVLDKKITQPDQILNEMHKGVRMALKQEDGVNQEGMDMSVCVIDFDRQSIEYGGAKNPMMFVHTDATGKAEIIDVKADKMPIGGHQKEEERRFTRQSFKGGDLTMLYMFSDGYQDQFGGPDNKKFGLKRMREIFLKIHQKSMADQKRLIERTFEEWKREEAQIDDVLVMGIRLTSELWKKKSLHPTPVMAEEDNQHQPQ